jgi:hypothetical protein
MYMLFIEFLGSPMWHLHSTWEYSFEAQSMMDSLGTPGSAGGANIAKMKICVVAECNL